MKPKPPKNPLKAARKGSRDAEIAMYGHPLPPNKVHKSKRQYDRKNAKTRLKKGGPGIFNTTTPHATLFHVVAPAASAGRNLYPSALR